MIKKIKFLLSHPNIICTAIITRLNCLFPDKIYLKILFFLYMGKRLNLKNPQTFNEKLQWLKLYNRRPEYTTMVDKYAVKKYVADIIGEEYIIPTLGVWDKFDDIDFDKLPNQFVLKTTHGGGSTGVVICKDKATFDKEAAKQKLSKSLNTCLYEKYREWPYKNVPRRILAEKYMEDETGELRDFKFFCFNGNVDCVMICFGRKSGATKFYFFDKNWKLKRYNKIGINASKDFSLPKPQNLEQMFELATMLSSKLPFARIDFYNNNGTIYFGEITLCPSGGFDPNILNKTESIFGNKITLPTIK